MTSGNLKYGQSALLISSSGQIDFIEDNFTDNIIKNNIIYNCLGNGMYIESADSFIYNNLVYNSNDSHNADYGIYVHSNSTGTEIKNNIAYKNDVDFKNEAEHTTIVSNNLFSTDPLFIDEERFDFRLSAGSPAIDTGYNTSGIVDLDFNRDSRPIGSGYDIGPYEYKIACEDDEDCSDNLFCNGIEACHAGSCVSSTPIDCSDNSTHVSTCLYDPDNDPSTLDLYSFVSECNETTDSCSSPPKNWTELISHSCNKTCGAQCAQTGDCPCQADECIGNSYYDYPEFGECIEGCTCNCQAEILENDPRCVGDSEFIDSCRKLNKSYRTYFLSSDILNNSLTGPCLNITADHITIDCNGKSIFSTVDISGIYSSKDYVTIKDCNINMGNETGGFGIELRNSYSSLIRDNTLYDQYDGIYMENCTGTILANNTITHNYHKGIHLHESYANTFENNSISSTDFYGIMFTRSSHNTIRNNKISNGWYGILIEDSETYDDGNNMIISNIVKASRTNIYVKSSNNLIQSNKINGSTLYHGIYIYEGDNNTIRYNNVTSNIKSGIRIRNSNNNSISNNRANSNLEYGIEFSGSSEYNRLSQNNFCSNAVDVYCDIDQILLGDNYCSAESVCGGSCQSCEGQIVLSGMAVKEIDSYTENNALSVWELILKLFGLL
jgi:parallel beta-helix repeat protein